MRWKLLNKKTKINLSALCLSFILINMMTEIMNLRFDKFQISCVFMLLYLCITEVLSD